MKICPFFLLILPFLFASCSKWDLGKKDFINIQITDATLTGIDSVRISVSIGDLSENAVNNYGLIWALGTEAPSLLLNDGKQPLGFLSSLQDTSFVTEISGLLPNKTYTFAAYAVAGSKAFFSEPVTLHTETGKVFSHELIYERGSTIELIGQITGAEAGVLAIAHGFCWSYSNPDPSLADSSANLGSRQNSNNFSLKVQDWPNDSSGYFRAFGILQSGLETDTLYGDVLFFDGDLKDAYTRKSSPGWTKREGAVGFAIGSKGYIGSGRNGSIYLRDFWQYDPSTDTWTQIQDLGYPVIGTNRAFAVAFSIGNYGYVGTGLNSSGQQVLSDWWRYNPLTNTWDTPPGNFPGVPRQGAIAFVINGKAYVGGGKSALFGENYGDFFKYDPNLSGGTWTSVSPLPGGAVLANSSSFALYGKGYCLGGNYVDGNLFVTDEMYNYTPSSGQGSWQFLGYMNLGNRDHALGLATSTNGYLCGGTGVGSTASGNFDDLWEFDPALTPNDWVKKNTFPFGGRHYMAGFVINDRLYFGTGSDPANRFGDFWEYDPN